MPITFYVFLFPASPVHCSRQLHFIPQARGTHCSSTCECIVVRLANRVWAIEYAISVPHRNRLCNQL